jgi:hypothetical protein
MGMSGFYGSTEEAEAIGVIQRALDLGCAFLDTDGDTAPPADRNPVVVARGSRIRWRHERQPASSRAALTTIEVSAAALPCGGLFCWDDRV